MRDQLLLAARFAPATTTAYNTGKACICIYACMGVKHVWCRHINRAFIYLCVRCQYPRKMPSASSCQHPRQLPTNSPFAL